MKQQKKRMSLFVKLLIYIVIFAIGGYFFFMYMPQGFKDLVTPKVPNADTTLHASPEVSPAQ